MVNFKNLVSRILPKNQQSEDGRDQWPSRTAFLLASVGGAVGQGNIIRYPSQVGCLRGRLAVVFACADGQSRSSITSAYNGSFLI